MKDKKIKIVIGSDLEDVRMADIIAERLCNYAGIPQDICSEIRLCMAEAVNNSIIHAYDRKSGKEVEISFCFCPDRLMLHVCDTGTPMSLDLYDLPCNQSQNQENTDIPAGGRGFEIIKKIMDTVDYVKKNQKNCLIMTKILKR
ncbi:MAG: ATP-binding protein [Desulfococcaceae bacterium]